MVKSRPIYAVLLFLGACGGTFEPKTSESSSTTSNTLDPGENEPSLRVIFHHSNFTDLNDFVALTSPTATQYKCLGNMTRSFYVSGDDYSGSATPLPTPSTTDALNPTRKPVFVKNISVDMTNTYYPTSEPDLLVSDVCSFRDNASAALPTTCADFDQIPAPTPAPTIAPTPTPSPSPIPSVTPTSNQYFDSGFYRVRDDWCTLQGPIVSPDPEVTKANVGGVNIDLDRSKLGSGEDLLMVITYHAVNENASQDQWPASVAVNVSTGVPEAGTDHGEQDRTILRISLMSTFDLESALSLAPQPRPWTYSSVSTYPVYLKELATLQDPFGSLRTEQIYVPLSKIFLADRIRIERVRGSYHLYQVDLYRLGNRSQ